MSFEAITTISDAENRARQIKADAQAAAAAAVEAAQAEGKAAIEAALWPDEQFMAEGYLYFCAGDPAEGTTVFAKTYEEHKANIAKYESLW